MVPSTYTFNRPLRSVPASCRSRLSVGHGLFLSVLLLVAAASPRGTHAARADTTGQRCASSEFLIDPRCYDIWHGKQDHVYLAGFWKLKKLEGTANNPPDDAGTIEGFAQPGFDDSSWDEVPVPWDLSLPHKDRSGGRPRRGRGFDGVYWYRRTIELPDRPAGTRAILFFGQVNDQVELYVNGKYVGRHENRYGRHVHRGDQSMGESEHPLFQS